MTIVPTEILSPSPSLGGLEKKMYASFTKKSPP